MLIDSYSGKDRLMSLLLLGLVMHHADSDSKPEYF
jgi:hypothetical protein